MRENLRAILKSALGQSVTRSYLVVSSDEGRSMPKKPGVSAPSRLGAAASVRIAPEDASNGGWEAHYDTRSTFAL